MKLVWWVLCCSFVNLWNKIDSMTTDTLLFFNKTSDQISYKLEGDNKLSIIGKISISGSHFDIIPKNIKH